MELDYKGKHYDTYKNEKLQLIEDKDFQAQFVREWFDNPDEVMNSTKLDLAYDLALMSARYEDQIEDLLRIGISDDIPFDDTYFMSDVDNQIYLWLSNSNQDFRVSIHRFSKCIDAIRYGYEVSDNDK